MKLAQLTQQLLRLSVDNRSLVGRVLEHVFTHHHR